MQKATMKLSMVCVFIMFFTIDLNAQWVINSALKDTLDITNEFTSFTVHANGDRLFASTGTVTANYTLYYSDDDGASWQRATVENTTFAFNAFSNSTDSLMYAYGSDIFGNRGVQKSTDNGATWTDEQSDMAFLGFLYAAFGMASIDSIIVINGANGTNGMVKSSDGGKTWAEITDIQDEDKTVAVNDIVAAGDYFFISTSSQTYHRMHKDSISFRSMEVTGRDGFFKETFDMEVTDLDRIYYFSDQGLHYTDDYGQTFTFLDEDDLGFPSRVPTKMELMGNDLLFVFGEEGEPSTFLLQGLTTLVDVSSGIDNPAGLEFFFTTAATSTQMIGYRSESPDAKSLWQFDKTQVATSNDEESAVPETFSLEQNYPNPFNPSTNIPFELNQTGFASLKVYDMLGREVATLINGRVSAGAQTVVFDAQNLSSGVYYYRLVSGGQSLTRAMTLIK